MVLDCLDGSAGRALSSVIGEDSVTAGFFQDGFQVIDYVCICRLRVCTPQFTGLPAGLVHRP